MRAVYFKQTLAVCALGAALVACDATNDEVAVEAASNDLFAPVTTETDLSVSGAATIPSPLANTNVAVASAGNIPTSQPVFSGAASGAAAGSELVSQTGLNAIPVPVFKPKPATVQPRRVVQAACPRPTTKAALAAYAANCARPAATSTVQRISQAPVRQAPITTARQTATTQRVVSGPVSGQVSTTFAPATVSCGSTPTTKAALAAHRANCTTRSTSAPVAQPVAQTPIAPPVLAPAAPAASSELNLAPAVPALDLAPASAAPAPAPTAATVVESATAPESSSLFDCSQDPTTGAELALFRAYCQ